ncbi:putative Deoxyribodipyrimidine photo-lyase [Venustampulla echinocandica]|uniref:Putative Deoxyribodipyrimidine photo-lyase n=1 Tax=Venustampulla echinocandica TaxID=2656787 RepID=A0A370TE55_9HELO|nr:putative Deoxyribodipyrimidine photo-lyase [Venustampulla echinocandica]RDL32956.1 putative Deoxyribodipyrimidine photo-lyase [Venustampulla echinocandica]
MDPVKSTISDGKRRASTSPEATTTNGSCSKKSKITRESPDPLRQPHFNAQKAEDNGIVLRKFYPPEMSNARATAYNNDELPRPIEVLQSALSETESQRQAIEVKGAVVHWFKSDLRTRDNKALHMASEKAKEKGVPLIAMYIVSPQDFEAHLTAPARVDFILRTLEVLKEVLAQLNIPLHIATVEKRKAIPGRIVELLKEWGASHLFANMEYEVDELRREAGLVRSCLENDIAMDVVPDTCVVAAGEIENSTGKQYSVFTPWFRSWIAYIHGNGHVLDIFEPPGMNPDSARDRFADLFESKIPDAPDGKKLSDEEKKRFSSMWPAGEHEAHRRLNKFCEERIGSYIAQRDLPGVAATSALSVHLASGTLNARTAVSSALAHSHTPRLDGGSTGMQTWIREIGWRDFYKHVLAHWPYICMNKPWKATYSNIEWEYNPAHFEAWCAGRTGYPIVDAAMRQLRHCGYMHNRCRMIAASFLAKHLLVDWRMGERYFMEHLIDGDFASNNGGWGYCASTGVDPQPYFRIFNPLLQSEKFDADGVYIRTWVKELEGIGGRAVHDPYGRGKGEEARLAGYSERIVPHKESRERCIERYQEGIGGTPK